MPRKKNVEIIEQPIRLSGDVEVIVRAPKASWPHIHWDGGHVEIDVNFPVMRYAKRPRFAEDEAQPETHLDTPELIEQKRKLQARHPEMQPKPYTSKDAFADAGWEVGDELTAENLEAAAGATVV